MTELERIKRWVIRKSVVRGVHTAYEADAFHQENRWRLSVFSSVGTFSGSGRTELAAWRKVEKELNQ